MQTRPFADIEPIIALRFQVSTLPSNQFQKPRTFGVGVHTQTLDHHLKAPDRYQKIV